MLAWMLCFLCGRGDVDTRCCDMIEVSHVVDRDGRVTFVQLIAWKLHPEDGKYHAHGWRMIHPHEWPMQHGSRWIVYGEGYLSTGGYKKINYHETDYWPLRCMCLLCGLGVLQ